MKTKKKSQKASNLAKKLYMESRRSSPKSQYEIVSIRGDGNCLYRAISYGIYNTEDYHIQIRLGVIDYLTTHWDDYKDVIKVEYARWHIQTKEEYAHYMSRHEPGLATYAGHIELTAAAIVYNVCIQVHLDPANNPIDTVGNLC